MHRSLLLVVVALSTGCAHRDLYALDVTTTTAAAFEARPASTTTLALESTYAAAETDGPQSALGVTATTAAPDAQIAALFQSAGVVATSQAELALAHARDPNVRDFAREVDAKMHDLETGLAFLALAPAPARPAPTIGLVAVAGQPGVDFDRAYLNVQTQALGELVRTLDEALPSLEDVRLRQRLARARRPLLELYDRASALERTPLVGDQ